MASVTDYQTCDQCGFDGAVVDYNTRTYEESTYCPNCGHTAWTRLVLDRRKMEARKPGDRGLRRELTDQGRPLAVALLRAAWPRGLPDCLGRRGQIGRFSQAGQRPGHRPLPAPAGHQRVDVGGGGVRVTGSRVGWSPRLAGHAAPWRPPGGLWG